MRWARHFYDRRPNVAMEVPLRLNPDGSATAGGSQQMLRWPTWI